MALSDIEHFVIVLLENRSFDHVSGYLSLATTTSPMAVDGLSDDPASEHHYANEHDGNAVRVHRLNRLAAIKDPPHDYWSIAAQINTPRPCRVSDKMGGFAASYATVDGMGPSPAMGYYSADEVPLFDFFARNFTVCDQWFSSLPTGTQPNRLMAMSGKSDIWDNVSNPFNFPQQDLVYNWLDRHDVSWCSYSCALPFFCLMKGWRVAACASLMERRGDVRFRSFSRFREQWSSGRGVKQVIFIEPHYTDDPVSRRLNSTPNDDHPPTNIAAGQHFLSEIYTTLISNPELWARTLMIVTYDEHGGFFDHVSPLPIWTAAGGRDFTTSGVRVPAFIVGSHVSGAGVFGGRLEHTSILQLLADRFADGEAYSGGVEARLEGHARLADVISAVPREATPPLPDGMVERLRSSARAAKPPRTATRRTDTAEAFHELAIQLAIQYPAQLVGPYWHPIARYVLDIVENERPSPAYPLPLVRPGAIRMKQLVAYAASRLRSQLGRPGSVIGNIRRYRAQQRILAERARLGFI